MSWRQKKCKRSSFHCWTKELLSEFMDGQEKFQRFSLKFKMKKMISHINSQFLLRQLPRNLILHADKWTTMATKLTSVPKMMNTTFQWRMTSLNRVRTIFYTIFFSFWNKIVPFFIQLSTNGESFRVANSISRTGRTLTNFVIFSPLVESRLTNSPQSFESKS